MPMGEQAGWPTTPPPHDPLGPADPVEVGPYRLEAVLGGGGMGRVYLGRTPAGSPLAVKVVHHEYAADRSFRLRFEHEVATAKRVRGLYTATVVDADVNAAVPWLATAYIPGPSLQFAVAEHGPLPVDATLELAAKVAEALQSIHAADVIHRDLKPSNVILTTDGPKVIDFGIARAAELTSVTGTGMRPGTPAYTAPEHILGQTLTPAADVFALGVLINFAATGQLAFGGNDVGVTYRIRELDPDLASCPEPLRDIVMACLDKDPRRRPAPIDVIDRCRRATTGAGHLAPPAPTRPDPREVCPYRGLEPFHEEHAEWFRGRAPLVERLLDLVGRRPAVVVAGPSGSGKSSLVRAGLVPAVRPREMDVVVFRTLPGEPPLTSVARALLPVLEPALGEQALLTEAESLAARLSSTREQALPWLADRLLAKAGPGGLLVVVDQFEELTAERPHAARELFELLLDLVGAAPRQRDGRPALAVVVTLRPGALDNLITDRTAGSVADGVLFVPPMTRTQLAEAISPPGVVFEAGLVERILDDAGTEPGTLPLVEFAMARLWERRGSGVLTHDAYTELGGVTGALAGFAEGLYGRLTTPGQAAARRLLLAMARPDENGGFLRRPLRRADVADELRPTLDTLCAARLVVVGRAGDGTEIVELAHQALLDRWPRLAEWLAEERDFLTWREQLRTGMTRWLADDRDPGGLLRGAALARAESRLTAELSDAERGYVRASQARERRRLRVLRGVIVVISVLALVAAGLAVWATTANNEARQQLRLAQSRALAEESTRSRAIDPRMSLQLAQAAWHLAPTSEAYGALLTHYAGVQQVDKVFQNPWEGNLTRLMTSPDGSITVAVNENGIASTWGGLNGDAPHRGLAGSFPDDLSGGDFQLSPSGKLLAYANGTGVVAVWDLERHTPAVMLRDTEGATRTVGSMAFSTDETRLLIKRSGDGGESTEFELWDLVRRETVRVATKLGPQGITVGSGPVSAFLGPTPDTVVIGMVGGGADVYDAATGRLLRSVPVPSSTSQGHVALNGAAVVQCASTYAGLSKQSTFRVVDLATGRPLRSFPAPDCLGFKLDSTGNYAIADETAGLDAEATNSLVTVTDLRTGRAYRLTAPKLPATIDDRIAVYRGGDGHPVALAGNKNVLYRQRLTALDPETALTTDPMATYPGGDIGANLDPSGAIELIDLSTGESVGRAIGEPVCWGDCGPSRPFDFSPDGKRLLTVQEDTLVVYAVPSLDVEARMRLPVPAGLGGPPTDDGVEYYQWSSSLSMPEDDRVTVLHAGMITRWDLTGHTQLGTPTQVRPDGDGLRRSGHWALLEQRPDHPDEAVVVHANGAVELWHLDEHRITARLGEADRSPGSVRFGPKGAVAAVSTPDGKIQLWNADLGHKQGRLISAGPVEALGFTPDGKVLTVEQVRTGQAKIWDQDSGKLLATLTGPGPTLAANLENNRFTMFGQRETRSVPWDPAVWQDKLCQLNDRDFTDDERAVLAQQGAPEERPCG